MAKAVAKRKLKNSYYEKNQKENIFKNFEIENNSYNGIYRRNGARKEERTFKTKKKPGETNDFISRIKKKFLLKISIQTITMIALLTFVFLIDHLNIGIVKRSEVTKNLIAEFNKNYTVQEITSAAENFLDRAYLFLEPIIPDGLSEKSIAVFNSVFSNEKQNEKKVQIYNEKETISIYEESMIDEKDHIGVGTSVEDKIVTVSSSISTQEEYIRAIKNSGVEFVRPTTGVITSNFGAREEIFKGVDSYHYGTDIANNIGTPVYSSIDGTVTICSYNDETGNYIEVQNGNITTRYCHLSKKLVKVGDVVKKGQEIGKMGDTGLVTGPHLHFEIMYNRNRVDASMILKLD